MKVNYLVFLLFSITLFSQKTIVPKEGTIVFIKKDSVTDIEKYKKSFGVMASKMVDFQIEKELVDNLMKPDTDSTQITELKKALISIIEEDLNKEIENKDLKYHQIFKNHSIINYATFNGNVIENYNFIDTHKKTFKTIAKDSTSIILENIPYQYSQNEIIKINEFRDEIKTINGFKCFKIIMLFRLNSNDEDEFESFMQQYLHKKELWVTDKIKCNYHPVINDEEILSKYYPLEILESNEIIEGLVTSYKLNTLSIK